MTREHAEALLVKTLYRVERAARYWQRYPNDEAAHRRLDNALRAVEKARREMSRGAQS